MCNVQTHAKNRVQLFRKAVCPGRKVAAGLERGEARRSARSRTGGVCFNMTVWAFIHVITLGIPRTGA